MKKKYQLNNTFKNTKKKQKEETYLNLVMDYIPDTLSRVIK